LFFCMVGGGGVFGGGGGSGFWGWGVGPVSGKTDSKKPPKRRIPLLPRGMTTHGEEAGKKKRGRG